MDNVYLYSYERRRATFQVMGLGVMADRGGTGLRDIWQHTMWICRFKTVLLTLFDLMQYSAWVSRAGDIMVAYMDSNSSTRLLVLPRRM